MSAAPADAVNFCFASRLETEQEAQAAVAEVVTSLSMATSKGENGSRHTEAHHRPSMGALSKRQKVSAGADTSHSKLGNGGVCVRQDKEHTAGIFRQSGAVNPASGRMTNSDVPSPREKDSEHHADVVEHGARGRKKNLQVRSSVNRLCPSDLSQVVGSCDSRVDYLLQVIIRTRPPGSSEVAEHGDAKCLRQDSDTVLTWLGHPESQFVFDYVARESITQVGTTSMKVRRVGSLFLRVHVCLDCWCDGLTGDFCNAMQQKFFFVAGLPVVDFCFSGHNSSLFSYGQVCRMSFCAPPCNCLPVRS